jgi:glycosyltransferase involved in cell wall biosynthesis
MKLAVFERISEPFSLEIYRKNVIKELKASGVEIVPFNEDTGIPDNCDVVWEPAIAGARRPSRIFKSLKNKPLVVTVHGASPFVMPIKDISYSLLNGIRGKLRCYLTLYEWIWFRKKVTAVITVSNFALREIAGVYRLPLDMVNVIYHGIDHTIFNPDGHYHNGYYFLVVGGDRRIKNIERTIDAYRRFPVKERPKLVGIVPGYKRNIKVPGVELITEGKGPAELAEYYRGAICLVFPSLRESFGMPILEAMACGCPVITSNSSACAEIAQDAALLVNPYSVDEIAKAMGMIVEDASLRETLRKKGIERASFFSWQKCAKEHLKVFEKVLRKKNNIGK